MTYPSAAFYPKTPSFFGNRPGLEGQVDSGFNVDRVSAINSSPAKKHIVTLTFAPSAGGETFSGVFTDTGDESISYDWSFTAAAGDNTAAEVGVASKVYFDGNTADDVSAIRSKVAIVDNLDGTVSFEAYAPGTRGQFTMTSLVGNVTAATTATGAEAAEIPFARAVFRCDPPTSGSLFASQQRRGTFEHCSLPNSTIMPATNVRFTYGGTYTADEVIQIHGVIKTGTHDIPVLCSASHGSTEDGCWANVVAQLNNLYGSYLTATATAASNRIDIAADQHGIYIDLNAASQLTGTTTTITKSITAGASSNAFERFLGVSTRSPESDTDTIGTYSTSYKPMDGLQPLRMGRIWVPVQAGTAAKDGSVWVSMTTGKFAAQATSGYVEFPRMKLRWDGPARADGTTSRAPLLVNYPM